MKSAKWEVVLPMTKSKFHDPAVRDHPRDGYEALRGRLVEGGPFVAYDEAFEAILDFVDGLTLPEE